MLGGRTRSGMEHQGLYVCFHVPSTPFLTGLFFVISKVTLIEPGPFRTEIFQNNIYDAPQHPAYADPDSRASQARKRIASSAKTFDGNTEKAAIVIEKVSRLEDPPVRFPLHRNVVASMREKAKGLLEVADRYESWNEDLYHDE